MSSSSPGTPADDAPSSSVEKEEDGGEGPGVKLSRSQRKKRAKKQAQAQKGEKNSPRPLSAATVNIVDNPIVQESKPVDAAPVDIPAGEGEGVLVAKTESGEDEPLVMVDKPDVAATATEVTSDGSTADDDVWGW